MRSQDRGSSSFSAKLLRGRCLNRTRLVFLFGGECHAPVLSTLLRGLWTTELQKVCLHFGHKDGVVEINDITHVFHLSVRYALVRAIHCIARRFRYLESWVRLT